MPQGAAQLFLLLPSVSILVQSKCIISQVTEKRAWSSTSHFDLCQDDICCLKSSPGRCRVFCVLAVWSQLQHFSLVALETTVCAVQPNNAGGCSQRQVSFAGAHCCGLSAGEVLNFRLDLCSTVVDCFFPVAV